MKIVILTIIALIQCITSVILGWSMLVAVIGSIKGNKKEKAKKIYNKNFKFDIVICAHNEENVICGILDSLKKQTYSSKYWKVFLIADNCTDNTVKSAEKYDFVTIYEHKTDEGAKRKGIALKWGLEKIIKENKNLSDAFILFDADNQIVPKFLEIFNEKFCEGSKIITGNRVAMNPYDSMVSSWYTVYWSIIMNLFCKTHRNLGLSATLSGTGLGFLESLIIESGFNTYTLTEDIEFATQQSLKDIKIDYAEDAIYYDEQPTKFFAMVHQLSRWATGGYQTIRFYIKEMIKKIIKKPSLFRFDCFIAVLSGIGMSFSILAGIMISIVALIYGGTLKEYALMTGISLSIEMYIIAFFAAKQSGFSIRKMLFSIILYPIFIQVFSLISLYRLFIPEKTWHKIEHKGKKLECEL